FGREVVNVSSVAFFGDQLMAATADGRVRIVVNLAAGDEGQLGIEQRSERAQNAALGLAAQPQQDEIMARENGVGELRHHGIFVADDAGEYLFAGILSQAGDEILPHLVFYPAAKAW